jgi:cold shock CspA family protein/ribosome-associated translation inhibitor RaiA
MQFTQIPLEISFRGVEKTKAIEELIRRKAGKLERICNYITSARVAVESSQEHQRSGSPYRVRIYVSVPPGHELVVKREESEGHMHEELPTVVRDVFDAAERQLKELVERQRGEVKSHPEQERVALVDKLFAEEDYGFLKTMDGRVLYFHRNSVLSDDFDRLEIGTGVRYVEAMGDKGPQASTVQIVDKPGARILSEGETEPDTSR